MHAYYQRSALNPTASQFQKVQGGYLRHPPVNVSIVSEGDVSIRFGCRLRELRRDHKLTQRQMAHRFGMDRSFISEVERGRKSVSLVTLEIIALGFRMSLADVMRGI